MYRAMNKYGPDAFSADIICCVLSPEFLNETERFFINKFNTLNPKTGYNIARGGDGGDTWANTSPEERQRRIAKQVAAQRPMWDSKEWKTTVSKKVGAARREPGRYDNNHKICSDRMKKLNKNKEFRKKSRIACAVKIRCVQTGEIFDSLLEAARRFGVSSATISNRIGAIYKKNPHPNTKCPETFEVIECNNKNSNFFKGFDAAIPE